MRSRIAAILTVGALLAGTGGAVAVSQSGASGGPAGGATAAQYKPGKGCGDKNHQHTGSGTCPTKKKTTKGSKKKSSAGAKSKKPKSKSTGQWPNCTIRQAGSLIIAYCP